MSSYVLRTTNSQKFVAQQIRRVVESMSEADKQKAVVAIRCKMLLGEAPNPEVKDYVERLLNKTN